MKPHAVLFLALGVLLAGCNDAVVPQCPSAAVLSDTDTLTVFRAGAPRDLSGEAYTAAIGNVRTDCSFPKAATFSTSTLNFTLRTVRAPSPDGADYTLPYYLAVTQGDRILSKQNLTVHVVFAPGSASRQPGGLARRSGGDAGARSSAYGLSIAGGLPAQRCRARL